MVNESYDIFMIIMLKLQTLFTALKIAWKRATSTLFQMSPIILKGRKKNVQVWKDMRVSNGNFWLIYSFKICFCMILHFILLSRACTDLKIMT